MAFVVPDVCRFSLLQTYGERTVANVIDFQVDTTGSPLSREDAIADLASEIVDAWYDNIRALQSTEVQVNLCTWVDLDEADGSTGSSDGDDHSTPYAGAGTGTPFPANVAVLVNKVTVSRRGQRQGRLYMVGGAESWTIAGDPNSIATTPLAAVQSGFDGLYDQLEGLHPVGLLEYEAHWAVTHVLTRDAEGHPLTGSYSTASSLAVQNRLATQRRRLRG